MNVHLTVQVPRSPELNQILDRIHHKLEALLYAFQPELVQLQGRLVRHTSREGVLCRLNLHLPTGQLSSEKAAATAQTALRAASDELTRQLHKHKQRLRETRPRWRPAHLPRRRLGEGATMARAAELSGYFGAHYQHLLGFVRRQVELRERLGELPEGWLDPHEVLDEVVVEALSARPGTQAANRGRWFLLLAAAAMRRLAKSYGDRPHGQLTQSLDQAAPASPLHADGLGRDDAAEGLRLQDVVAADRANPEEAAATAEAMERLAAALAQVPQQPRHDLVLYLLEGFRPKELAQLTRRSEAEVRASLEVAEAALQAQSNLPWQLQSRVRAQHREAAPPAGANPAAGPGSKAGLLAQRA